MFVLVDADPHGIDIASVYQFGSMKSQNSTETKGLALKDRLVWIGVKATSWSRSATCNVSLVRNAISLTRVDSLGIEFDRLLPLSEKDIAFVSKGQDCYIDLSSLPYRPYQC